MKHLPDGLTNRLTDWLTDKPTIWKTDIRIVWKTDTWTDWLTDRWTVRRQIGRVDWLTDWLHNNYSMSPSWIWSDKITNERVARVGYNHFIFNKGEWNNCFSKFSHRVLPPIFISTILQSGKFLNLAHYFPYDVKLRLLALIIHRIFSLARD